MANIEAGGSVTTNHCLLLPQIWDLALQPRGWPVAVSEHLLSCRRCRGHLTQALTAVGRREAAERKFAAALLLLAVAARGRARQPFALPRPAERFDSGKGATDDGAVFDFEDSNLKAIVSSLEDGGFLLRIEHRGLEPGHLVLALVQTPTGSVDWARYVMLRQGYRQAIGHVRLPTFQLDDSSNQLFVDPVTTVPDSAADLLRDSFVQASLDAPESFPMWRAWARQRLQRCPGSEPLRRVMEEMIDSDITAPS